MLAIVRGPFVTLPNVLSLARVPLAAGAIACLATGQRLAAQLLMVAAFATDALDGAVARATNSTSEWGRILDPMADKLVFAVVGLSLAVMGLIPWWLVGVIVGRDLLITIGGILHIRGGAVPRPIVLGKVSTVILALYLCKQAFWPAPAAWLGLDVLGWIAVGALGLSTAAYIVHDRRHRPVPSPEPAPPPAARERGEGAAA